MRRSFRRDDTVIPMMTKQEAAMRISTSIVVFEAVAFGLFRVGTATLAGGLCSGGQLKL